MPFKDRADKAEHNRFYYRTHQEYLKRRTHELKEQRFLQRKCFTCSAPLNDDEAKYCFGCSASKGEPIRLIKGVLKYAAAE